MLTASHNNVISNKKNSMKLVTIFIGLCLLSCSGGGIKYGESGDDNSHLRNPQYPKKSIVKLAMPDSILQNNKYYYRLEDDLMLNGMFIQDTFYLKRCYLSIAKPDSVHRGGPLIIKEFGVDDFDIYIGKSHIYAGHGQILSFKIRDRKLNIYTVSVGSSREYFEKIMKIDFPDKNNIECLSEDGGYYSFIFDNSRIKKIDYFASTL